MKVAIVVITIGSSYIEIFNNTYKKNLQNYCNKYGYELIVLDNFIKDEPNMDRKQKYWQKLLIPHTFSDYDYVISMDSDIYVNPNSPPIPFDEIPDGKVGAVNERKYLGNYEWREKIQEKNGWEKTGKDWYALSGECKTYNDHINSGFVIYQPKYHGQMMKDLYEQNINNYTKYHQDDQSILSSFIIDNDIIHWLDERFNRIWYFWREIFYPNFDNLSDELKQEYIHNFINLNYFTHFTGNLNTYFLNNLHNSN